MSNIKASNSQFASCSLALFTLAVAPAVYAQSSSEGVSGTIGLIAHDNLMVRTKAGPLKLSAFTGQALSLSKSSKVYQGDKVKVMASAVLAGEQGAAKGYSINGAQYGASVQFNRISAMADLAAYYDTRYGSPYAGVGLGVVQDRISVDDQGPPASHRETYAALKSFAGVEWKQKNYSVNLRASTTDRLK